MHDLPMKRIDIYGQYRIVQGVLTHISIWAQVDTLSAECPSFTCVCTDAVHAEYQLFLQNIANRALN